jgi:hypothetical protein
MVNIFDTTLSLEGGVLLFREAEKLRLWFRRVSS